MYKHTHIYTQFGVCIVGGSMLQGVTWYTLLCSVVADVLISLSNQVPDPWLRAIRETHVYEASKIIKTSIEKQAFIPY